VGAGTGDEVAGGELEGAGSDEVGEVGEVAIEVEDAGVSRGAAPAHPTTRAIRSAARNASRPVAPTAGEGRIGGKVAGGSMAPV
jgi:hypothetical protein